jgi:hypothetical protein
LPGDTLLDEAAAKIGVDQTAFGPCDCLAQTHVRNSFVPGKSREPPRLENLHGAPNTMNYST